MPVKITLLLASVGLLLLNSIIPSEAADKEFDTFWQGFKQALQTNDQKKLVAFTRTPFLYQQGSLNKEQLTSKIGVIFSSKIRKCILSQRPIGDPTHGYSAFCGETIYSFTKDNGHYLFTDIGAND